MTIASGLLRGLVRGYQLVVSPLFPPCCKYAPTCSHYAIEALSVHGPLKGTALAVWRVLRCNPFARGGYDPVPGTDPAFDAGRRGDGTPSGTCADPSHAHSHSAHTAP